MELFKLTVEVAGRNVELVFQQGQAATAEFGTFQEEVESAEHRVSVFAGFGPKGLAAWVQTAEYEADGSYRVVNEGWISEGNGSLPSTKAAASVNATLVRVSDPSPEMLECQAEVEFGLTRCCTATGRGCYVRCCNSCCSDPHRCPGARCCAR